jgi:GAF domain-containing protein
MPDPALPLSPRVIDPHAALYRVASLVGRTDESREALTAILAVVIDVFGASCGSISLLNPDSGKLEIEVHQGMPAENADLSLRLGQGITGWVAFHGRPQLVADVRLDSRYIVVRPDVRSEMAAPMLEPGGQTLGVINVDSDRVGGFSEPDLALFVRMTEEATSVIRRLWQLQQLRDKARQLESLIAAGHSLVTKLEPQELFNTITRDARRITQTHACALYLCEAPGDSVQLASLSSQGVAEAHPGPMPLDSCLVSASSTPTSSRPSSSMWSICPATRPCARSWRRP